MPATGVMAGNGARTMMPMRDRSRLCPPDGSGKDEVVRMPKNGEGEILEWLGGQQGAMLSLLEELVNIDGGSYDKAGVDAVGARIRAIPREPRDRLRDDRERDLWRRAARDRRRAVERRHHADGPSRHGVSQGRADAPPVPDRERQGLWAGRRRHEGRPGDECVRARGIQEVRRRAGAAGRAVHLGRGDRLARLPADHRGGGAARPRGVQLRAGPAERQRGDAAARAACS